MQRSMLHIEKTLGYTLSEYERIFNDDEIECNVFGYQIQMFQT
jgi:hypothetical protein